VLVPSGALRKDGDKDIVFVVKDQKAQRRAVSVGGTVGDSRQVLAGVSAGETVVVDGPPELKDGAAVKVAAP
jgi:HlyD family secretion protein